MQMVVLTKEKEAWSRTQSSTGIGVVIALVEISRLFMRVTYVEVTGPSPALHGQDALAVCFKSRLESL